MLPFYIIIFRPYKIRKELERIKQLEIRGLKSRWTENQSVATFLA